MSAVVLRERVGTGVDVVTLNRPERLNAMNADLVGELHTLLDVIAADESCRVVILTGAGRGFCSGFDLDGYGQLPGDRQRGHVQADFAMQRDIARLVPRMRSLPQPIIAAVNGPAAGGGLSLVLACDVRLAASTAKFNAAFVRLGLSGCDISTSWTLPRLVGVGRAHEMMLTGRFVAAEEAAAIGLVLECVPPGQLLTRAVEEAALIMANAPLGVALTKEVMWASLEATQRVAMDLENRNQVLLLQTRDHVEARTAFAAKRGAQFQNA